MLLNVGFSLIFECRDLQGFECRDLYMTPNVGINMITTVAGMSTNVSVHNVTNVADDDDWRSL